MTPARPPAVRGIVLDVEGTTTPIAFVYDVLFPFARARLGPYLARHAGSPPLAPVLAQLSSDHARDRAAGDAPPPWPDPPASDPNAVARYADWLMTRDRKVAGLKNLQGLIWQEGFETGQLEGQVFDDVPDALGRWRAHEVPVFIYSSGSVLAQRLLFGRTRHGDLTPLLSGYFDTAVGPKTSPDSYRRIAVAVGVEAQQLLFVSDVLSELEAARAAGWQTALCVRPGNRPVTEPHDHPIVHSLDEIDRPA